MKIGRNEKCYCGSGKKFKKCHLYQEQGYVRADDGSWSIPEKKKFNLAELGVIGPTAKALEIPKAQME